MSSLMKMMAVALAFAVTGAASAATFSFASDDNPDNPTFAGMDMDINDGESVSGTPVTVELKVGPSPPVAMPAIFRFAAAATPGSYTVTELIPGASYLHTWRITGTYSLFERDLAGDPVGAVYTVDFYDAVLSSLSSSDTSVGSVASIVGEGTAADLDLYPGPNFASTGLGFIPGIDDMDSFSFTLTAFDGARPTIDGNGNLQGSWTSEGSYSSVIIPEPATVALAGLGSLMMFTRRRAA